MKEQVTDTAKLAKMQYLIKKGQVKLWQKIFLVWSKEIDVEGLTADVKKEAENGSGNYREVPHGNYEVEVNKLKMVASKKGDPIGIWFKIVMVNTKAV